MIPPNAFDASVVLWLDRAAQHSHLLDRLACGLEGEELLKGGVLTPFLWWAWFRRTPDRAQNRAILIAGIAGTAVTLAICRTAAYLLPFRVRPIFEPSLHFVPPFGTNSASLINWSSFPSDHAGMFSALAVLMFFVSRSAGILASLYAALFIFLPRLYLGNHYPTDILAGIFIGAAVIWLFERPAVRDRLARIPLHVLRCHPARFYALCYVASLLLATNFEFVRKLGGLVFHSFRTHGVG